MNRILISCALAVSAIMPAHAQSPAAPVPLPVLKPEQTIPLAMAVDAAQTALDSCKANNSLAVVLVVDMNDIPKVLLAADGARGALAELARRKAYTVIKKGMASGDYGALVGPQARGAPPLEGDVNLITFGGAFPIKRDGAIIGAIAVSGPTGAVADAACAQAGLARIQF